MVLQPRVSPVLAVTILWGTNSNFKRVHWNLTLNNFELQVTIFGTYYFIYPSNHTTPPYFHWSFTFVHKLCKLVTYHSWKVLKIGGVLLPQNCLNPPPPLDWNQLFTSQIMDSKSTAEKRLMILVVNFLQIRLRQKVKFDNRFVQFHPSYSRRQDLSLRPDYENGIAIVVSSLSNLSLA